MPNYVINNEKTDGRYNEVHVCTCAYRPTPQHRVNIGWHANAIDAVAYAVRNGYTDADGCGKCCKEAHKG